MDVHNCKDKKCKSLGKFGVSYTKKDKGILFGALLRRNNSKYIRTEFSRLQRYEEYAEQRGFVEISFCGTYKKGLLNITPKGINLTDNLFLPLTPVGLWKAIWSEHKIVFTVIPTLFSGLGITLVKYLWSKI